MTLSQGSGRTIVAVTVAHQSDARRRPIWPVGLTIASAAVIVVALIASGFAAVDARTHGRLTTPPSNPLALEFAPPDYTMFWICIVVAAIGAVALVVGVVVTTIHKRAD